MLILVRHAHAGDKENWQSDDAERPLSERGREQAAGLVRTVAGLMPTRLVSSPYLRCRQTLAPLAAHVGLPVLTDDVLSPDAKPSALARALVDVPDERIVVSTHGETLSALLRHWKRKGTVTVPLARRDITKSATEKGGVWIVLDHGSGLAAHYMRPLHVDAAQPDLPPAPMPSVTG